MIHSLSHDGHGEFTEHWNSRPWAKKMGNHGRQLTPLWEKGSGILLEKKKETKPVGVFWTDGTTDGHGFGACQH